VKILSGAIIFRREMDSQMIKISYKYNSTDLYSDNNEFFIFYPKSWPKEISPNSDEWKILNNELQKIVRKEAKRILPNRVLLLSSNMVKKVKSSGILKININLLTKINNISIKNNRTNWGSCSGKKNINLNMNLLNLPIELVDYIIMHELCHLIYHDHSQNFHNLLNFFCEGREKEFIKEIKKYSLN
jgi:Predicted metal-dependent hydrolase